LRAVADSRIRGSGFLPAPSAKPMILFEGTPSTASPADATATIIRHQPSEVEPAQVFGFAGWRVAAAGRGLQARPHRRIAIGELGPFPDHGFQLSLLRLRRRGDIRRPPVRIGDATTRVVREVRIAAAVPAGVAKPQLEGIRACLQRPWFCREPLRQQARRRVRALERRARARGIGSSKKGDATRTRLAPSSACRRAAKPSPRQRIRRENPRRRNVRADAVDLRDWEYRPNIAIAPRDTLIPNDPAPIKQQAASNACTGFALATVIEYLLDRGQRPVESMSGYMLYSMARRYDEWAEDDESTDSGSSLRGALKGWSRHGASAERLWRTLQMPKATNDEDDWWLDAVKRPMGAYYRIDPKNIRDMHVALTEVGAIYASAYTHTGWDALLAHRRSPAPVAIADIPVMQAGTGRGATRGTRSLSSAAPAMASSCRTHGARAGAAAVLPCCLTATGWPTRWTAGSCRWALSRPNTSAWRARRRYAPIRRAMPSSRATRHSPTTRSRPSWIDMENEGQLSQRGRFPHQSPTTCACWWTTTWSTPPNCGTRGARATSTSACMRTAD
jgi:hypothetical protein